jgi:hypothetical protein
MKHELCSLIIEIAQHTVDPCYRELKTDYVDATLIAADAPDNWFELLLTAINVREIPLTLD